MISFQNYLETTKAAVVKCGGLPVLLFLTCSGPLGLHGSIRLLGTEFRSGVRGVIVSHEQSIVFKF